MDRGESETKTKIMVIAMHPYILGVPRHIRYVEETSAAMTARIGVAFVTAEENVDWYRAAVPMPPS
jgi:hypothetical protein